MYGKWCTQLLRSGCAEVLLTYVLSRKKSCKAVRFNAGMTMERHFRCRNMGEVKISGVVNTAAISWPTQRSALEENYESTLPEELHKIPPCER